MLTRTTCWTPVGGGAELVVDVVVVLEVEVVGVVLVVEVLEEVEEVDAGAPIHAQLT
jgi:hypothetical protein